MAKNGNGRKVSVRRGRRAAAGRSDGPGAAHADFVALYNANCDIARDYAHTTLDAAERLQAIGVERGGQAFELAGRAASAFAAPDGARALAAQSDLARQVIGETLRCMEEVAAVSAEARRELLLLLDRQCRLNGVDGGLPRFDLFGPPSAARR